MPDIPTDPTSVLIRAFAALVETHPDLVRAAFGAAARHDVEAIARATALLTGREVARA